MATNKKRVLKQLLSLTLAVVMCFGFLPTPAQAVSEAVLTNGMPVTEENVLSLIEEYRNGKEPGEKAKEAGFTSYTHRSTYDAYNPAYFGGPGLSGTECAKFAFAFWDDIFGIASYREVTDPQQVKAGDLIHVPGHWYIATKSAFVSPYTGNLCTTSVDGSAAGIIAWGNQNKPISADNISIYTRYPLPYEFEDSEVHLTSTGPIGSSLTSLDGLDSVRLRASKDGVSKDFDLPIIWDDSTYDPWTNDEQTVEGKLDISCHP